MPARWIDVGDGSLDLHKKIKIVVDDCDWEKKDPFENEPGQELKRGTGCGRARGRVDTPPATGTHRPHSDGIYLQHHPEAHPAHPASHSRTTTTALHPPSSPPQVHRLRSLIFPIFSLFFQLFALSLSHLSATHIHDHNQPSPRPATCFSVDKPTDASTTSDQRRQVT